MLVTSLKGKGHSQIISRQYLSVSPGLSFVVVHHVLQDCPLWDAQRRQAWPEEEPVNTKLWGTANDLRRTIQFLTTLGLKV